MAQKCSKCNRLVNVITDGVCFSCRCKSLQTTKKQPRPKVIAIDFDGVLVENNWPHIGPSKDFVIDFVKELQGKGWKVILWTCRADKHLQEALIFCEQKLNLTFDAVNENIKSMIDWFGADPRKVSADIYLDDRALSDGDVWDRLHDKTNFNVSRLLKGGAK